MSLWLGIDGALGTFSAALAGSGPAGTRRTESSSGNDALEAGLGVVDRVLDGTTLRELAGIAVVTGPGSFTGLRIALSYAKSLAFAARLPLVGVSSYDAYEPPDAPAPCAVFVHGRAGISCVRLRLAGGTWTACGTYAVVATGLAERLPRGDLRAFGAAQGVASALGERGIVVRPAPPFAETPALAAALRALAGAPRTEPHAVDADYGEAHYAERASGRLEIGNQTA
ncbi:MAG: tRNA (adenosine(37)-N6)-threonylcarbamoyltransferase complex dimerization subunit type 1 TsaB [Candidatus Eremiobacteraeota bacterium]|nr:tRNA (adenosine(37)-N6)-threonylcarbamoyltransferase complex dimerization subunit type 1 TsaB [Candidatus Eremiobacteraeota bacterium]MBC5801943.1 tRNA (adenosine(37)-N6)-threonylcarbamoyltransferase complex dimerization subunit type 1 TsaB [Candidatus Eremiobacteraeota bacterium]MBC5821669.1 tRNA (adenosine(37)-N6)-threonylcarbamoyltransferase complex dimerization subunit type 1 TsaB [Candidatus Eremiobacteraeota bacterium]